MPVFNIQNFYEQAGLSTYYMVDSLEDRFSRIRTICLCQQILTLKAPTKMYLKMTSVDVVRCLYEQSDLGRGI